MQTTTIAIFFTTTKTVIHVDVGAKRGKGDVDLCAYTRDTYMYITHDCRSVVNIGTCQQELPLTTPISCKGLGRWVVYTCHKY